MNRVTRCVLPLLCAGVPTLAIAMEETENWYFGVHYNPMVELRDTEVNVFNPTGTPGPFPGPLGGIVDMSSASLDNSQVEFDNGEGYGIVLGYDPRGILRSELNIRQFENDYISRTDTTTPLETEGDIKSISVMANFWLDFNRDGHLRPYIGLGVGGAEVTLDGEEDDNVLMAQAGLGVNWHMAKRWVLDLGYRYFETDNPEFTTTDDADFDLEYRGETLLLGLKYNFGFVETESKPEAPRDSDGDGVTDDKDRCPGTAPGATVNADGCADSDGDGVIDSRDLCPSTPPGTPVTQNGCADADGDGIVDSADACPNSPVGQPVLNNGCGASQSAILQGVNFQLNSEELTSSAQRILEDVASALLDSQGFRIELQGHTDSLGSEDYNKALSQRRAESVKSFLVNRGIDADRLTAKGYGEIAPIADNSNAEGRAMNRRVELLVIEVQ